MSELKGTPGPWKVELVEYGDRVTDDLCILGPSPDFRNIASVDRCFQGDRIRDMEQANAQLIAAAPDLLEALESMRMALIGYTHQNEVTKNALQKCCAAIAKATGEPA